MGNRLYVGNLPYRLAEEELEDLFSQAGTVTDVTIISDRMTGQSKGFGFVEQEDGEDVLDLAWTLWTPEATVNTHAQDWRVPLQDWINEGWV